MFGVFLALWGWDDDVLEGYELILDGEGFWKYHEVSAVSCGDTDIL